MGALYISYTLNWFEEGVYNQDMAAYWAQGGREGDELWSLFTTSAPLVLLRTSLLTLFILTQLTACLAIFTRFLNRVSAGWQSLAASSYGIYLIHEPFVVWTHWFFNGADVPAFVKFLISGFGALFLSWTIVSRGLLKIPALRRIL